MALLHVLAVAVLAGALTAVGAHVPASAALAAALAVLSLSVPLPAGRARRALLALGVAALAAANTAAARDDALAPPLGRWFAAEAADRASAAPVRVRGVLAEDATRTTTGAIRLRLDVRDVDPGDGWRTAPGATLLFVQGDAAQQIYDAWTRGRELTATTLLRWPAVPRNPGGPHPIHQRLARGYVLTGTIKSAALVELTAGPWWHEAGAALRRVVRRNVAQVLGDDRRVSAAVVTAILIGDRAGLDPDVTGRLIDAGTYHVVAISGGNVALVTVVTVLVLRRVLRSPRLVALAALAAVVIYGWVVGGEPSVVRAVSAAAVWLLTEALGLRVAPARIFSIVLLLVVAADPLIVIQPGAWLSFGATLGILLCAGRLTAWVTPPPPAHTGHHARGRWLLRLAAGLGAATLAAELVLLPVGAWTFHRVSVAGLVLNFIAVPAMAVVQAGGVFVAASADLWPTLARTAAVVAHVATVLLVDSARLVDWMPHLAWRVPPPHPLVVVVYYVALGLVIAGRASRRLHRAAGAVAAVTLLIMATGPGVLLARPPEGTLRITFLDVGQGDATVVQFPSGHVLVVDAGAASDAFDAGDRIVTPALWALGARRVDWVAFTHADLDHIGGVAAVATEFDAHEVWEGIAVARDENRAALRKALDGHPIVWRQLRRGDRWSAGGSDVAVLHPSEPDWERQRVRNDDSIVLRVRYGPLDVLLTGDVGQDVERALPLPAEEAGEIRVLKVAHHGSRTSTAADLVNAYRPWTAIVSAGRNNTFGHPAPEVVARLEAADTTVFRTDQDGAVMVESDGRSVQLRTWTGRSWRAEVLPPR